MYSESLEGTDQEDPEQDRDMDPLYHLFIKKWYGKKK